MADGDRTFTDVEHAAILETEVARQTAVLRVAKEDLETERAALTEKANGLAAEKADLLTRIDVLEAERAAAVAARDAAQLEHTEFIAAQERAAQVETLKAERSAAVKEALVDVDEAYFTEARVARWAEMSAEAFGDVLTELKDTAGAFKPFTKKGEGEDEKDKKKEKCKEEARETAAFRGGIEPTGEDKPSALGQLLMHSRKSA